jgi:hypothetical protein
VLIELRRSWTREVVETLVVRMDEVLGESHEEGRRNSPLDIHLECSPSISRLPSEIFLFLTKFILLFCS